MFSFNFDMQVLLDQASTLINQLWPVFILPLGVVLGVVFVGWVVSNVRRGIGE